MNQPQKRRNPFDRIVEQEEEIEEKVEPAVEEVKNEPKIAEEVVEEEVQQAYTEPVRPVIKQNRPVQKAKVNPLNDPSREKYTSTMDITLRRRIKIVCATRGIMFSEFIEDACREKLRREGER